MPVFRSSYPSPLGHLALFSVEGLLCGLSFEEDFYDVPCSPYHPSFVPTWHWLDRYFEGRPLADLPPLTPQGTPFQNRVWKSAMDVPFGATTTYGDLAELVSGTRLAARAVGMALSCNPYLILIPCHRVLASSGSLGGFAAGLERKKALLNFEATGQL